MAFRITGLSSDPFRHLYGLSDRELAHHGVKTLMTKDTIEHGGVAAVSQHTFTRSEAPN
jgi:hypothetical protein